MDVYKAAGVDYAELDAAKREALAAALATSSFMASAGGRALDEFRGESAFVFEVGELALAVVLECLGTKSIVAREFGQLTGEDRFGACAYDTVAAIVNDLVCVGAIPIVVNAYFATGSADWYAHGNRMRSLAAGWQRACEDAAAAWGGGESPALAGLVAPDDIELAGCAVGLIPNGTDPIRGQRLQPGDQIVLLASSGIHANGLSLARAAASALDDGLAAVLPNGRMFGDALLDPSVMYVRLVRSLLDRSVPISYLSHITGHGLRKLMRADRNLSYRLHTLPKVPEVLAFLVEKLDLDDRTAYGTFNMGAGFAVFAEEESAEDVCVAAASLGLQAVRAGVVEEGPRQVTIDPLGITFTSDDLRLR